uniref:Oxysterol-binding protein n=1 Tax=Steinernema glaseri TaxID=37863 RepID=A0A1I7YAH0_9BILA
KGEGISYSSLATLAFRGGLPINTYEPLGTLQILCEEVRFASTLLSKATMSSDPIDRMCHVVAFAVTTYTSTCGRNRKPFNPLLGETFDYTADEGWRYHGEQVSHHPPISAGYADGPGWEWWQTFTGQPKTGWKNVELTPELPVRLRLNGNEDYTWNKVCS